MPVVPPCSLCKVAEKVRIKLEGYKKPILKYSIFVLFIEEIISFLLKNRIDYACYWFPLLSQFGFFVLLFSIFLWNEKLRFCYRKMTATLFLSMYFLFGFMSILFSITNSFYTEIVEYSLFGTAIYLFIISLLNSGDEH